MFDPVRFFRGFAAAWDLLLDFPFPLKQLPGKRSKGPLSAVEIVLWFPVLAILSGALISFIGCFVELISNRAAAAFIYAAVALAFLAFKDSGRGLSMQVGIILGRFRGVPVYSTFAAAKPNAAVFGIPEGALILAAVLLCKFVMLFLIAFSGAKFWIVAVCLAAFTVQGELAAHPGADGAAALLPVRPEERKRLWICSGVAALLFLLPFFTFATVAAGAVAYIAAGETGRFFARTRGGVPVDGISLAGALVEFITLIIGSLWALHL